ncbi:MAG: T9SS type A sorting domain-containing protein, partial [Flavobacteriales bacterium]
VIGMCAAGPYFLAATVGGGVFRTINAANWTAATGIASGDLNGEQIWTMGANQYYTAQGGTIYRSTSLGETWTTWTAPPQFGLGAVEVKRFGNRVFMESRHLVGGGQRDSLYFTTNGNVWTNITGNLNAADLNGSGLYEYEGDVFIGYSFLSPGQGLYRYSLSTGMDDATAAMTPGLFPNPATDQVTITMPDAIGSANITMHDATGRAVLVLNALTGTERIDISGLPAGCYILRADEPGIVPVRLVKR